MTIKYKSKGIAPIIVALAAILAFAISLTFALTSIGSASGEIKAARSAPDSLVSAGAPRSQLELKRMMESMSLSYTENGRSVYEPISAEYRASIDENSALSVEEILFIISDSSAIFDGYDIIRFRNADGTVEREMITFDAEQTEDAPFHRVAYYKVLAVSELIRLRVGYMSAEGAMIEDESGCFRYQPRQVEREKSEESSTSAFSFKDGLVTFESDSGGSVTLYPSERESSLCMIKALLGASGGMTDRERELLSASGYDTDRVRNITPKYWYPHTDTRLFVLGGRILLVDNKCVELLPTDHTLASAALAYTGEGEELYFTSSYEGGSAVWKYSCGELKKILESSEKYLAAVEPLHSQIYDKIEIYAASKVSDGRFVIALECKGEPIIIYS